MISAPWPSGSTNTTCRLLISGRSSPRTPAISERSDRGLQSGGRRYRRIADLYFFNLLGNLLFISDAVTDVVHNDMQFRNWPGQPDFDVRHHKILNASNNYLMRLRVFGEKVRPFLYFGLHYFAGVSVLLPSEKSLSLGVGLATVDPFADSTLAKVRPSGGVYWMTTIGCSRR